MLKCLNEYMAQPLTWVKIIAFAFILGGVYVSITSRIAIVEAQQEKIETLEIGTRLGIIENDVKWIKDYLQTKKK